ncbi:MAG: DMT family transporter [Pseudomonadota bacterium]
MTPSLAPSKLSETARGILYKIISAMIFTGMLTLVKIVGERVPVGQILFSRNFFGAIPVLIVMAYSGSLRSAFKTDKPFSHIARAMAGMFAMGLWFSALQRLSFPEATAIVYAAPLMMVALAAIVLGERVRMYRWTAVAVGMAGVLVILTPQIRTGFDVTSDAKSLGALLALGCAVFMAIAATTVRQLSKTEGTTTIVIYFLLAGSAVTALTAPTWVMPTPLDAAMLVMIGILGGCGQLVLTQAYHHAEASLIAPFEYTSMIWVVLIGYFVFAEVPSAAVLGGAAIVIASGIFVIFRERQLGLERKERKVGVPLRP